MLWKIKIDIWRANSCYAIYSFVICYSDMLENSFPPGPFVIPMSSDGCPGEKNMWHSSYINITTRIQFSQRSKFIPFCGKVFRDVSFTAHTIDTLRSSTPNLLRIFDKYILQWNFCYKRSENRSNFLSRWPRGNYSVYSTAGVCPIGKFLLN